MDSHAIFILSCSCYNLVRNMDAYMTLVVQSVGGLYDRFFYFQDHYLKLIFYLML